MGRQNHTLSACVQDVLPCPSSCPTPLITGVVCLCHAPPVSTRLPSSRAVGQSWPPSFRKRFASAADVLSRLFRTSVHCHFLPLRTVLFSSNLAEIFKIGLLCAGVGGWGGEVNKEPLLVRKDGSVHPGRDQGVLGRAPITGLVSR